MIRLSEHEEMLKSVGKEYFVEAVEYVENLQTCCRNQGVDLEEPGQPMAVVATDGNNLKLLVQAEIPEEQLAGMIKGLAVRWALKDTKTDMTGRLDSTKKRLGYCFLKDYSRTVPNVGGDEMQEDAWAIGEMEKLGFFNE